VLAQAQGGDQAAAAQLPEVARQLLTASRAVNASGPAFAADFQAVLAQTEAVAKLFEGQKSQQDQLVAYTGEMAYNTAALVESSKDQVAVLKEGFTTLQQQQEDMQAAIEQLIKETRAGNEGGRL
jgi:pyrroline-5-carboxylate reductase